jgi:hypothetical protein
LVVVQRRTDNKPRGRRRVAHNRRRIGAGVTIMGRCNECGEHTHAIWCHLAKHNRAGAHTK